MKRISSIVHAVGVVVLASAAMGLMSLPEQLLADAGRHEVGHNSVAKNTADAQREDAQFIETGQPVSFGACCLSGAPCLADLNSSGTVDVQDLLILLGAWGPNPGHPADLNNSGAVDVQDLLILLGAWGPCPAGEGCEQLSLDECAAQGGVFLGEDIPCGNVYCSPVPMALEFKQIDFVNNDMNLTFTPWLSVSVTYKADDPLLFLNLAIESAPGAPNPTWQIQNAPLPLLGDPGSIQTISFNVDLGNAMGVAVPSIQFGATITAGGSGEPIRDRNSAVQSLAVTMESGKEDPLEYFDPEALIYPTPVVLDGFIGQPIVHENKGVPNQPCGKNECVPAAVSNSLGFLNAKHGLNMPPEKISIGKMKDATGWGPNGTARDWWTSKNAYMQANGYQIETIAEATLEQVKEALNANHDVEIDSPNHSAVLVAVITYKGIPGLVSIVVSHDVVQDGTAGKDKQKVEGGVYDPVTGRIRGITWIRSLDAFTIERPTNETKTAKQIAKTLEWAKIHLEAASTLLDQLIVLTNTPGADPNEIAQKQNDAMNRLASALKLINKAKTHLQTLIDNGGCPDCPSVPTMQGMITALDGIQSKVEAAIGALATVIGNPMLPPDTKKALYANARNAANSAASQLQPIIDQLENPTPPPCADDPNCIPAGSDCWIIIPCGHPMQSHFSAQLPPGFFGPGSDPFLMPPPSWSGQSIMKPSMVINRLADVQLDGPLPVTASVPIELVELSLVSCQPIVVTYNGGQNAELWSAHAGALPGLPKGIMTITKHTPGGGTVDSFFDIAVHLTFTNMEDPTQVREMVLPPFQFHALEVPWQHQNPNGQELCSTNFAPGFTKSGPVSSQMINGPPMPPGAHMLSIRPWMPKPDPDDL